MNALTPIREDAKLIVEDIADDLRMALPATIPLDRFKATFITAVAHNPDILQCDVQSIKTALMKAASDNLMPDNREAALVPFNTKVKNAQGKDEWKKLAQYMPMVQGIRKRALELGGARITAECVYENDHFDAVLGDDPHIEHKPAKLGQPRGNIIGVYAIFKDADGNVIHREIMSKEDVESTRKVSRSKDGPAWVGFWSEMAKKAAVRRGSKSIPAIPDNLRTVIERDDEYVDFTQVAEKPRTIEHNPLLESNSAAPMESVDASTGEVIETKSSSAADAAAGEGSAAGLSLSADAGAPSNQKTSNTDKPRTGDEMAANEFVNNHAPSAATSKNSSQPSSYQADDGKTAERENPPARSAAADHAMSAADLKKAASFLARQDSAEKLSKAAASIKKGSETMPPPNDADLRILAALKSKLTKVIESGEGGASDELDSFNAHVDEIFGLDDFPGDE